MEIYFNWLEEWIRIENEEDNICGIEPSMLFNKYNLNYIYS